MDPTGPDAGLVSSEILRRLEPFGFTQEAREWLLKALHPANPGTCGGIPDQMQEQVVISDFRDSVVVGVPGANTGYNWDLLVVSPPGDVNCVYWVAGPAGTDFTSLATPVANTASGIVSCQPMGWFPNQMLLQTATGSAAAFQLQYPTSRPRAWRRRYGGLTCYMTASSLSDQGTVYATSVEGVAGKNGLSAIYINSTPLGNDAITDTQIISVPVDENTLQLVSAKPYVAPARHGAYVPARFTGYDFTHASWVDGRTFGLGTAAIVPVSYITGTNYASVYSQPLVVAPYFVSDYNTASPTGVSAGYSATLLPQYPPTPGQGMDTGFARMTVPVVLFRGLDPKASITIRSHMGIEMVPFVDSPQRQFVRSSANYSETALRAYHDIVSHLNRAYPASYNAIGALLPAIAAVAARAAPYVYRAIRAAPRFIEEVRGEAPSLAERQSVVVTVPSERSRSRYSRSFTPRRRRGLRSGVAAATRALRRVRGRTPRRKTRVRG